MRSYRYIYSVPITAPGFSVCYDINLFNRYSTFFVRLFDSLNLSFLQILEEVEGDKYFVQFDPIVFFLLITNFTTWMCLNC